MKLQTPPLRHFLIAAAAAFGLIVSISTFAASGSSFVGDFETGDMGQWDAVITPPNRVGITTAPVRQGRYAALFNLREGDEAVQGRQKVEAIVSSDSSGAVEGNTAWYGWSTFVPNDVSSSSPVAFTQWKPEGTGGCGLPSNVTFQLNPDGQSEIAVSGSGSSEYCSVGSTKTLPLGNLNKGSWNDFVLHVRWSANDGRGFIEVWQNDQKLVSRTRMATLHNGHAAALAIGAERDAGPGNVTLYHDAMRRGNSRGEVKPPDVPTNDPSDREPQSNDPSAPSSPSSPSSPVRFVAPKAPTGKAVAKLASVVSASKTPAKVTATKTKATPKSKAKSKASPKPSPKVTSSPSQRPALAAVPRSSDRPAVTDSPEAAPPAQVKSSSLTGPVLWALITGLAALGTLTIAAVYWRRFMRSGTDDASTSKIAGPDKTSNRPPKKAKKISRSDSGPAAKKKP